MNNQQEIDYATARLTDKNGGVIPSHKEVQAELEKRWEFKEQGINDNSVIDGAIDLAEEKQQNYDTVEQAIQNDQEYQVEYEAQIQNIQKEEKINSEINSSTVELEKVNSEIARIEKTGKANGFYTTEQISKKRQLEQQKIKITEKINVKIEEKQTISKQRAQFDKKYEKYGGASAAEAHNTIGKNNPNASKKIMSQTTIAAKLATEYSKSDFRDEKKMSGLLKTMSEQYSKETNSSTEHSKEVVTRAIQDAAKVKGVKSPNIQAK